MCCRSKHVWVVSLEDQVMRCKSCEVISMKGHGICFVLGSCRHPPGVILAASEQQTGASDASSAPSALSAVRWIQAVVVVAVTNRDLLPQTTTNEKNKVALDFHYNSKTIICSSLYVN